MKKEYKLKVCSDCGDKRIKVVIGEKGIWECTCGWRGANPIIQIVSSKEYLKFAEEEINGN